MTNFKTKNFKIKGAFCLEPKVFEDQRGFFYEFENFTDLPWSSESYASFWCVYSSEWRLMAATVFHTFCLNAQRILIDRQKIFIGDDLQNKSKYQSVDFY